MSYQEFIASKVQWGNQQGFDPGEPPSWLYDFQAYLFDWSIRQGRGAIFADCGMGKTAMQLAWAQRVIEHTNKPVLIATPLAVRNRTMSKALAHRQICEDSTLTNVAAADYLLPFRKKGKNPEPVTHETGLHHYSGERQIPKELHRYKGWQGKQTENRFSHWIWRNYASCFWDDIRLDNVLEYRESKDDDDERHQHPLQLDVIDRAVVMWSNPGDVVLTPFMGVGSEVYGAVRAGRRGVGCELKPSYYKQAVKNLANVKPYETEEPTLFEDVT